MSSAASRRRFASATASSGDIAISTVAIASACMQSDAIADAETVSCVTGQPVRGSMMCE
jgi:hypothetical protein